MVHVSLRPLLLLIAQKTDLAQERVHGILCGARDGETALRE